MAFNGLGSVPSHMCSALELSRHCNKSVNDSTATLSTERRPKHHHVLQIRGGEEPTFTILSAGVKPVGMVVVGIPKLSRSSTLKSRSSKKMRSWILNTPCVGMKARIGCRFAFERCGKPRLTSKDFCAPVLQPTDPCSRQAISLEKAKDTLDHYTATTVRGIICCKWNPLCTSRALLRGSQSPMLST